MKNILLAAAFLTTLSSCSKDENTNSANDGLQEIKLRSGIATTVRSAYDGDVAVTGLQFLRTDGSVTTNDFTGKTAFSGSRAADGVITFDNTQNYTESDNTYIASYFPAGSVSVNVVTWSIDAKTDVMTAATIDAGSNDSHANPGVLAYQHQLAQIEVICKGATADAITRWGNITGIKLKDTPTTMSYAYNGLSVTKGTVLSDISLVKPGYAADFEPIALPATDNVAANAVGMFTPSASQNFALEITTEKDGTPTVTTVTIDLGTGKELKAGHRHDITLTFNPASIQESITISSTIAPWSEGATGSGNLN